MKLEVGRQKSDIQDDIFTINQLILNDWHSNSFGLQFTKSLQKVGGKRHVRAANSKSYAYK